VQYQFAVPPERGDVVEDAVEAIAGSGIPAFLAVLKRFGPGTPGPLSFAQTGWTLALDFPVGPTGLSGLLDALDEMVAEAGGRIYLAKDARLRPDLVPVMYPRLGEMADVRRRVDPKGVLASDLSLRLGL
jgi:decaprenylphospho-beta-D-ribofuranose 2-oxidase